MIRPFHSFVSRTLCPNAKSQSKYDPRTISEVAFSIFFAHDIIRLDARAVKRIGECVADLILAVVYMDKLIKISKSLNKYDLQFWKEIHQRSWKHA